MATTIDVTLLDTQVRLIDSALWGPLGHGLSALIGCSSVSRCGIFVIPALVDADFCGNIKIMVYTLHPPVSILKGEKIAQLILFEAKVPCQGKRERGSGGFGSTGQPEVLLAKEILKGKATESVCLSHCNGQSIRLIAILDTGADVTDIPTHSWPSDCPLIQAPTWGWWSSANFN